MSFNIIRRWLEYEIFSNLGEDDENKKIHALINEKNFILKLKYFFV